MTDTFNSHAISKPIVHPIPSMSGARLPSSSLQFTPDLPPNNFQSRSALRTLSLGALKQSQSRYALHTLRLGGLNRNLGRFAPRTFHLGESQGIAMIIKRV